jgi:hypothetical protein
MNTKKVKVIEKAMEILKSHLTREEYLICLEIFAKQSGDSVTELREKTKDLAIDEILNQGS